MHNDWGGGSRNMNIDGLLVHPGGGDIREGKGTTYTQIYRNGSVEAVKHVGITYREKLIIPPDDVVRFCRDSVTKALEGLRELMFSGPAVVQLALMTVCGHFLAADAFASHALQDTGRDDLVLPDSWVEELGTVQSDMQVDALVRPAMDVLWQAFDFERCFEFDTDGKFAPRR
jgi:hypothetical protein